VNFLGFRIFLKHRLLIKKNIVKFHKKYELKKLQLQNDVIEYDDVYDFVEGWLTYARKANTLKLRKYVLKSFDADFKNYISTKEINKIIKYSKQTFTHPNSQLRVNVVL